MKVTDILCEVIDMAEVGLSNVLRDLEDNPHLLENLNGWNDVKNLTSLIHGDNPVISKEYVPIMLQFIVPAHKLSIIGYKDLMELVSINQVAGYSQYTFAHGTRQIKYPAEQNLGDLLQKTYLFLNLDKADSIVNTFIPLKLDGWKISDDRKNI